MKSIIRNPKNQITNNLIKCDECKNEFYLNAVGIHEADVNINNQQLTLIYFVCPKCNKIYRVSLQDARYYELKEDLDKTKNRIRKNYGSNKIELASTLDSMVFKKLNRLRAHTEKLNKTFPGTFTFVTSENNSKEKNIKYLP